MAIFSVSSQTPSSLHACLWCIFLHIQISFIRISLILDYLLTTSFQLNYFFKVFTSKYSHIIRYWWLRPQHKFGCRNNSAHSKQTQYNEQTFCSIEILTHSSVALFLKHLFSGSNHFLILDGTGKSLRLFFRV